MKRVELQYSLEALFECHRFKDYCPNGLQVEGRVEISRVVCGVTASLALIESAIAREADALVVHHGWFWRGEDPRVLATRKHRLARLLAHDINLFAYHLSLDAHPELGNNVQLARVLGWEHGPCLANQPLVMQGSLPHVMVAGEVARSVAALPRLKYVRSMVPAVGWSVEVTSTAPHAVVMSPENARSKPLGLDSVRS